MAVEGKNSIYDNMARKLGRINDQLLKQDAECVIEVMGVTHDFSPSNAILKKANQANIVTLELTRRVVQEGLSGTKGKILDSNPFWRGVITSLREHQEGRIIRGIEVNQTPRVGWKRFSLQKGQDTLSPGVFTVEVCPEKISVLSNLLSEEERERLLRYHWLMSEERAVYGGIVVAVARYFDNTSIDDREWPMEFYPGLRLVTLDAKGMRKRRKVTTFITPPDKSLDEAFEGIKKEVKDGPVNLNEVEQEVLAMQAMCEFVLAPAELKDAEEIVYTLNQFVGNMAGTRSINCLHLGGAAHSRVIAGILRESGNLGGVSTIRVDESWDPRFGEYRGDLYSFFKEKIPFPELYQAVRLEGFETFMNPEKVALGVREAMLSDPEDFERRVLIKRVLRKEKDVNDTRFRSYRRLWKMRNELYGYKIGELRELAKTF